MIKKLVLLLSAVILVCVVYLPSYTRLQDKKQQNQEYQRKIQELKKENAKLRREKQLLEEDPVYLEKVAREKMGIIREGEIIYRITPLDTEE